LNATLAAGIVEAQFPQLVPARVAYLGEGGDSMAFDVNDAWVFRFPKHGDAERQLLVERQILPVLSESAPLPIPIFSFHGEPSPAFPRHFGGYRKLAGVPGSELDPARVAFPVLAPAIGRFLSWLHAFPAGDAVRRGVVREPVDSLLEERRAATLADFDLLDTVAPDAPLEIWRAYIRNAMRNARPPAPALVHNDVSAEHILLDETARTISGVIDWGDVAISDPAIDLAGVFHWGGPALVDAVFPAYQGPADDQLVSRARFLAACQGVEDVRFGLDHDRREFIVSGLRALRLCAGP